MGEAEEVVVGRREEATEIVVCRLRGPGQSFVRRGGQREVGFVPPRRE